MGTLGVRLRDSRLGLPAMRDLLHLAEQRGYDSVWLPESVGRESVTELTALALSSERIRLGTGIVPVFTRLPTMAAAALATTATVAPGRVILGVGIGHRDHQEAGHGIHFHRPIQHVREFVTIARRLLTEGHIASYAGEVYTIEHFQLDTPPPQPVPVYIAALRPQMLRLAGAVADGVLMNWATLEYIPQAIEYVRQGAEAAGRSLRDIQIACYLRTCVTDNPEHVERESRTQIARYGSMVYYREYFASIGFAAEATALEQAWQQGDAAAAARAVTPAMIRTLTIYGSAEVCRQRLQAYREAGLQLPIIAPFPIGEPIQETFARTIAECA
ncbi:MAG: LLM class flavin-dependent oxidoreductase [Candidatus Tectomicrobia bacterium]|uniref:LLM class flavin-dependent oxidoreductase n=1 Tax=Tectimicrobiota bacterium TaxID=2528274 RepID=A0A937W842_UNCTE|nr:LLM class flavin-dependent oxidoreductase [Candidatus Tectomicrobia bacterium]